jgi:predicted ATPase
MGVELQGPHSLALLAEAYEQAGQIEEGLTVLAEALTMVSKNGERVWEAELYRLKGEFLLAQDNKNQRSKRQKSENPNPQSQILGPDPQGEAETCFLKAIEIACQQQAKSWELRASTSLARLWQQQGKYGEAHTMLSQVYHWFTEGLNTKDLQEAKALLEELLKNRNPERVDS